MKKTIFVVSFAVMGIISSMAFTNQPKINSEYCNYGQCSFVKKNGYQCQNCAQKDSYYCWSHNHQ